MGQENGAGKPGSRWIRWAARIWSAPIILYTLILFGGYTWNWLTTGTADPYAVGQVSTLEALPPILMLVSVIGLLLSWRWEKAGSMITLAFQLLAVVVLLIDRPISFAPIQSAIPYLLSLVIIIPGILFWVDGVRSDRGMHAAAEA